MRPYIMPDDVRTTVKYSAVLLGFHRKHISAAANEYESLMRHITTKKYGLSRTDNNARQQRRLAPQVNTLDGPIIIHRESQTAPNDTD